MRPIELKVKNFLGIKDVNYRFEPGVFVMVGRNGSGKSSFFEAIHFALFGRGIRFGKRGVKPYIKRGSSRATVDFIFERWGKIYRVVRVITSSRSRGEIYEIVDGKPKHISEDVNGFILDILGMDPEVFQTVFLIPQGRITDIMERMGDLRNMIMRVTGFEERKKAIVNTLWTMRKELEMSQASAEYRTIMQFLDDKPGLDELEAEMEKMVGRLKKIESELKEISERVDELKRQISLGEKLHQLRELQKEFREIEEKARLEEKAEKIQDVFPLLDQLRAIQEAQKELKAEIEKFKSEMEPLSVKSKELKITITNLKRDLQDAGHRVEIIEGDLNRISEILRKSRGILIDMESLSGELKGRKFELERVEREIKMYTAELVDKSAKLKGMIETISKLEREIEEIKKKEIEFLAGRIASQLKVGDICPVCGGIFEGREIGQTSFDEKVLSDMDKKLESLKVEKGRLEELMRVLEKERVSREERKKELLKFIGEKKLKLDGMKNELERIGYREGIEEERKKLEELLKNLRQRERELENKLQMETEKSLSLERELEKVKTSILEKEKNLQVLQNQRLDIEKRVREICEFSDIRLEEVENYRRYRGNEMRLRLRELGARIEEIKSIVGNLSDKIIEKYVMERKKLEEKKIHLERERDHLRESIGEIRALRNEITEKLNRLREIEKRVKEESLDMEVIEVMHRALSSDRFDDYLFHRLIPKVVENASLKLRNITSGEFSLEILSRNGREELRVVDSLGNPIEYRSLSGGEKTIVALVMALSLSETLSGGVELFFIDEGFSALDSENRENIVEMLNNLENGGKTVIFITHFEDLASRFEKVIKMESGRIMS